MCSIYEMPVPKPPTDGALDILDDEAGTWLIRVDIPPDARRFIRNLRDSVRGLRIQLAKTEAQRDSIKAVADAARDERVARRCPGSWQFPNAHNSTTQTGLCPRCNTSMRLEGVNHPDGGLVWRVPDHEVPALRPA